MNGGDRGLHVLELVWTLRGLTEQVSCYCKALVCYAKTAAAAFVPVARV